MITNGDEGCQAKIDAAAGAARSAGGGSDTAFRGHPQADHFGRFVSGPAPGGSGGNWRVKVDPRPWVLSTVIVPPCRSTIRRVIIRPMPVPFGGLGAEKTLKQPPLDGLVHAAAIVGDPVGDTAARHRPGAHDDPLVPTAGRVVAAGVEGVSDQIEQAAVDPVGVQDQRVEVGGELDVERHPLLGGLRGPSAAPLRRPGRSGRSG